MVCFLKTNNKINNAAIHVRVYVLPIMDGNNTVSRVLTVFITQSAACKSCKGGKWGNAGRKLGRKKVPIEREEG